MQGKGSRSSGYFPSFHLSIISRLPVIDMHYFIMSTAATKMVINSCGAIKGILNCFHSSQLQVQVTYFSHAEHFLIGRKSHCLKIWRSPGGWENFQVIGNLLCCTQFQEKKMVVIRSFASGSPRMKHPKFTSFSPWMGLLDWQIRRLLPT